MLILRGACLRDRKEVQAAALPVRLPVRPPLPLPAWSHLAADKVFSVDLDVCALIAVTFYIETMSLNMAL